LRVAGQLDAVGVFQSGRLHNDLQLLVGPTPFERSQPIRVVTGRVDHLLPDQILHITLGAQPAKTHVEPLGRSVQGDLGHLELHDVTRRERWRRWHSLGLRGRRLALPFRCRLHATPLLRRTFADRPFTRDAGQLLLNLLQQTCGGRVLGLELEDVGALPAGELV
jgi:hypothetical protein